MRFPLPILKFPVNANDIKVIVRLTVKNIRNLASYSINLPNLFTSNLRITNMHLLYMCYMYVF